MEIVKSLKDFKKLSNSVITVGNYDGIHKGHHDVLSYIVEEGKKRSIPSCLITFDPNPFYILSNKTTPINLQSLDLKLETLKKIGLHINGYRLLVAFFVYGNNHLKTMLHEKFIQQSTGTHGEINSFVDETTILFAKAPFGCRVIQAAIDTLPRKQQLELIKNGLKLTESVKAM